MMPLLVTLTKILQFYIFVINAAIFLGLTERFHEKGHPAAVVGHTTPQSGRRYSRDNRCLNVQSFIFGVIHHFHVHLESKSTPAPHHITHNHFRYNMKGAADEDGLQSGEHDMCAG